VVDAACLLPPSISRMGGRPAEIGQPRPADRLGRDEVHGHGVVDH
jgi:hypothetical protein